MRAIRISVMAIALLGSISLPGQQQWQPVGPEGGTVRSLSRDPNNPDRIFLGTSAGNLYLSTDNGTTWSRFAHLGNSAEMVLDHIVIDPSNSRNMVIAAWNAQLPNSDGDLYRSKDAGKTWEIVSALHGRSFRALSIAPSDPKILVAGSLDGVYRSRDGGSTWERISPENHAEIRTIESVAIDPLNPEVIFAGTWHLPWKTEDGGKSWHSIKKGVIDDSDVFSIVIDPAQPANMFISACSGIYRSESAGELFRKIQGIPYSARRTRMLQMDPLDHKVVYAGTTEGLWKTTDSGATWKRMTGTNIVVNDVLIDPRHPERVLLATDRSGVLASDDGGATFKASNRGFTHRQAVALLTDKNDTSTFYAGVLNDKEFGGVFVSHDAGQNWKQISDGLEGHDVFVLRQAADGSLIAGTESGVFQLMPDAARWAPKNAFPGKARRPVIAARKAAAPALSGPHVTALEITPQRWYTATTTGLFVSSDSGNTWQKQNVPDVTSPVAISVSEKIVVVAGRNNLAVSVNGGVTWLPSRPPDLFAISSLAVDSTGDIWMATLYALYRSTDAGDSWKRVSSLRLSDIMGIQFDEENHRIFVNSGASTNVFESSDNGRTWTAISAGWPVRSLRLAGGRLLGTTAFDGIVLQTGVRAGTDDLSPSGVRQSRTFSDQE